MSLPKASNIIERLSSLGKKCLLEFRTGSIKVGEKTLLFFPPLN